MHNYATELNSTWNQWYKCKSLTEVMVSGLQINVFDYKCPFQKPNAIMHLGILEIQEARLI